MNSELKLLAITSLPTVGNAGLKNILHIIGDKTIPVPTLIACGLGNMQGHKKLNVPFYDSLQTSLKISKENDYQLIVYVGYLNNKEQISVIKNLIMAYRKIIKKVIIDPICGDNNTPYIDKSIIDSFDQLFEIADYLIPNETELRILMGYDFETNILSLINQFENRFPDTDLIIKNVKFNNTYYNYYLSQKELIELPFNKINTSFSGTGDLFASLFIKYVFFNQQNVKDAITKTASDISKLIAYNVYFEKAKHDLSILDSLPFTSEKGNLFYVVGPSGVGKDTLINFAKKRLKNSNVIFAQRYITRDQNAGGENHIAISKKEFFRKN